MATEAKSKSEVKSKKAVKLFADQFYLNKEGELLINNDEIAGQINTLDTFQDAPEAGGLNVGVSVGD